MSQIVEIVEVVSKSLDETLSRTKIDNPYIKKILERNLSGQISQPPAIGNIISNHKKIEEQLIKNIQTNSSKLIDPKTPPEDIYKLIIDSLLHEKLVEHKELKQSNLFKWISGILVIIVPVITGFLSYYSKQNENSEN